MYNQQQTQLFQDSPIIWYVLLSTVNNQYQSACGKKSKSSVPAEQHLLKNWGNSPKKQPLEAGRGFLEFLGDPAISESAVTQTHTVLHVWHYL